MNGTCDNQCRWVLVSIGEYWWVSVRVGACRRVLLSDNECWWVLVSVGMCWHVTHQVSHDRSCQHYPEFQEANHHSNHQWTCTALLRLKWMKWIISVMMLHCKAILAHGQPGLMRFGRDHAPGAGLIDKPLDLQSNLLPLCYSCSLSVLGGGGL